MIDSRGGGNVRAPYTYTTSVSRTAVKVAVTPRPCCELRKCAIRFPYMSPARLRLQELRTERNLSQSALATAAVVRRATIVEIEGGKASRVSLDVLERLAIALDVNPGDLFVSEPRKKNRDGKS